MRARKTKTVIEKAPHPENFKMKAKILAKEEGLYKKRRVKLDNVETKISKTSKAAGKNAKKVHGNTGRKHSAATKLKMSLAHKKRWAKLKRALRRKK